MRQICTKENPRPSSANKKEWLHPDAKEVGCDDNGDAKYECLNCNCYWYEELAD